MKNDMPEANKSIAYLHHDGCEMAYELVGLPDNGAIPLMVWGHGWGQKRAAFALLVQSLASRATHLLLDFPGFGESSAPQKNWGTAEYADAVAALLRARRITGRKVIWIGHSFGCRVGVQLAARHGDLVDGLFLIAAAGLPRRRGFFATLRLKTRIYAFKFMKAILTFLGRDLSGLRAKFGSADYRNAGDLRDLFLRVVREDLSHEAQRVRCPVRLVYGARDTETPPEIGARYAQLMPNATLNILPEQDHYSVLGSGRHPVLQKLAEFMGNP